VTAQAASIRDSTLEAAPDVERSLALWLTNVSHAVNHFQNNMVASLYPIIMAELGIGYFQLGTLTAIRNIFGNGSQILYGFLTPFVRRSHLLGTGNLILGFGTLATGMVSGYGGFIAARTVTSIGSSANTRSAPAYWQAISRRTAAQSSRSTRVWPT